IDATSPTAVFSTNKIRRIPLNDPTNSGDTHGKDPRGIAIDPVGKRAYVMNLVSRDVSVVNLATDQLLTSMSSSSLPTSGSAEAKVLQGKEFFDTSIGGLSPAKQDPNDPNSPAFTGRYLMSDNGWGSCFNCHPF